MGWINGRDYHEGDAQPGDQEVPARPSVAHEWNGLAWVLNTKMAAQNSVNTLEAQQVQALTARARREMDLGSIVAIRLVGAMFEQLGTALSQPAIVAAALSLKHIGQADDKNNPGTWIDIPGVAALVAIDAAAKAARKNL